MVWIWRQRDEVGGALAEGDGNYAQTAERTAIVNAFIPVSRNPDAIDRLKPAPYIGLDAEWDVRTGKPTIWGLSDGNLTISGTHEEMWEGVKRTLARPNFTLVGHNFLQADLLVLRGMGVDFPVERIDDTICYHWLINLHLCKAGSKFSDGDGDKRGRGFMGLFSACNLATGVPNWKACVGEEQCEAEHRPCPTHDVFGYNGNDAAQPVLALPQMKATAKLRGVDWLYPLHRDLSVVMGEMTEKGIYVDRDYIAKLEDELEKAQREYYHKEEIHVPGKRPNTTRKGWRVSGSLGFNPGSSQQVLKACRDAGISLKDSTEDSIRDALEDNPDSPLLSALLDYKELGAGSDRWFAPREWNSATKDWEGYVDGDGYIHPNFSLFTSSGRLASSNPNFQNLAVRRGKAIRKAVVPPVGMGLWEADLSNAENRAFLFMAGYTDLPKIDLHSWVLSLLKLSEDHPFAIKMGGARQAAKSVQHASNYGEGLSLLTEKQLKSQVILREERNGARIIFRDWTFTDGRETFVVSFTGIHLAERAFGNHTLESRRLALGVQESYFAAFPMVRNLQRRIAQQVEREGRVSPPSGLVTLSYGQPADRIKTALALWGSQPVAHWTKLAMLKSRNFPLADLRAQIHDALLFYFPISLDRGTVIDTIQDIMTVEILGMEGLALTSEVKTGPSWGEMEAVK